MNEERKGKERKGKERKRRKLIFICHTSYSLSASELISLDKGTAAFISLRVCSCVRVCACVATAQEAETLGLGAIVFGGGLSKQQMVSRSSLALCILFVYPPE